jgi:hypothetical protein
MARSGARRLCPSAVRLSSALFGPSGEIVETGTGCAKSGTGAKAIKAMTNSFFNIIGGLHRIEVKRPATVRCFRARAARWT